MHNSDNIKILLESKFPLFWSLLNRKARENLPKGIIGICTGASSEIEYGMNILEGYLKDLENLCGWVSVGDNYRRHLSKVASDSRLAELLYEMALCAHVGKLGGKLQLQPPTGKGTFSDCLFNVHGFDVYGEVKRYTDAWPHIVKLNSLYDTDTQIPYSRSAAKSEKPGNSARPRSMDMRSKLKNVYKQLPEGSLNILFVFHRSFGETRRYMSQTLFGDSNCFSNEDKCELKPDGLFSLKEWKNISACFLARLDEESRIIFSCYWKNPNALSKMPDIVLNALLQA
jgi:hypothetical protein